MKKNENVKLSRYIRINALKMTSRGGSSHIGSIFSCADIISVLFSSFLNFSPLNYKSRERDRFILSKGHAGAAVYAALAFKKFFPEKLLKTHCSNGSCLSGHVSHKGVPGVEFSTGSLGHGLPVASGLALSLRISHSASRVVTVMSDGECNEGSVWEAALFAAHHNLSNLIVIIDRNFLQSIKSTEKTLALEPFSEKWKSFGWSVQDVDGHDHDQILKALLNCSNSLPNCIIARTIKGKGVSFMENNILWHYRTPRGEEFDKALEELEN